MNLEIIYRDEYLVAINKPCGLLVHKTNIAKDANEFAIQLLRDQIGQKVYPVHRLDRKTSGVLLFALSQEMNAIMSRQFMEGKVSKTYLALVRGFTDETGTVNYELKRDDGKVQSAITHYKRIKTFEINLPHGNFETSRYSLVEVKPETGRMHQIRRHFAHLRHPIIGDRPHGCNKQNKLFLEKFELNNMLLHANELRFVHPDTGQSISIKADLNDEFSRIMGQFRNLNYTNNH